MALSRIEEFRRAIRDLNILAEADVRLLWRSLNDPRDAKSALMDLLPDVVETYGLAAASLAADFYDGLRVERGVAGAFTAVVPEVPETGSQALVAWALDNAQGSESFQSLVLGGVQKRISNGARNTITTSSIADPHAQGWMRVGTGRCDFCAMLISRGAVYSESSVDFAAHDWDKCDAAPAFDPEQVKAVRDEYAPSAKQRSEETREADNARVREWIATNL